MDTKVNKLFFQGPEGSLPLSQESYIFAIPVLCGNKQELIFKHYSSGVLLLALLLWFSVKKTC